MDISTTTASEVAYRPRTHWRWLAAIALASTWAVAAFYETSNWDAFAKANNCKPLGRDPKAFEPSSAPFLFECGGTIYKRW